MNILVQPSERESRARLMRRPYLSFDAAAESIRNILHSDGEPEASAMAQSCERLLGYDAGKLMDAAGMTAIRRPRPVYDLQARLDAIWAAVNTLGAPDSACITESERGYCQAIGDALAEIEKLGGRPS